MKETTSPPDENIHLGLILDGNRRWTRDGFRKWLKLSPVEGHKRGFKALVNEIIPALSEGIEANGRSIKVDELSLFVFAKKNWKRPEGEVSDLMAFMQHEISSWVEELMEKGIKLTVAGDLKDLAEKQPVLAQKVQEAVAATKDNTAFTLNLCLDYDGHEEIARAVNRAGESGVAAQDMTAKDINENLEISRPVDLVVRTSGEERTSNFMNWQIGDAETIFEKRLLPAVLKHHAKNWLKQYSKRRRRLGR